MYNLYPDKLFGFNFVDETVSSMTWLEMERLSSHL